MYMKKMAKLKVTCMLVQGAAVLVGFHNTHTFNPGYASTVVGLDMMNL